MKAVANCGVVRIDSFGQAWVQRTITPDPKYFANLDMVSCEDREVGEQAGILKDPSGKVYPLTPLGNDGEDCAAGCAHEDDKDGTDP